MQTWTRAAAAMVAAVLFASCRSAVDPARPATRPNVLLVTIDTWRADRLRRDVTPNLSALAARGVTFIAARSAVPLTLPSHATILTGLLPPAHGVRENGGELTDAHATVARRLRDAGYRTAAFVGAFVLDRRFGLANGFDVYDDRIPRDPNATDRLDAERPAAAVVDTALAWLEQQHQAPFFVWLHLYDPHAPYRGGRYDADVSYADAQLARVFDRLAALNQMDRTAVIVAGDHGEGLGEHGEQTHGMLLYDATLRVPLFVLAPGVTSATRTDAVSLADIAPTILALAHVEQPREMAGADLLGGGGTGRTGGKGGKGGKGEVDGANGEIYAETNYPRVAGWSALRALTDGRWKAIRAGRDVELYDLTADPGETKNLAATQASAATAMVNRIAQIDARSAQSTRPVSAEASERLRALGYVASSAQPAIDASAPGPASHIADWNRFEAALTLSTTNVSGAVPLLRKIAGDHPEAPVFQTSYARALKDAGNAREALSVYRAAAKRWPADATLLHDLGVAARDAGARDEAAKAEQAALALDPRAPAAHNGLGLLAVDQGRAADALRSFNEAARLDPTNATYVINAGNAARALGDRATAEQMYRKALDLDGRAVDAANGLGVLLVEAKRPAEAVQWFARAVEGSPSFVEARLNLGIALEQSGQPQRAADAYRAVLAADGNYPREKSAARALLTRLGAAR